MRLRRWKSITVSLVLLITFFITGGYLLSDDLFFHNLINKNQISSPEQAFAFLAANTGKTQDPKVAIWTTPRNMLTRQKDLSCDQGAIVLATIVHELGYETRLVSLQGDDGISHHTILEVNQNGTWKTYDTLQDLQGVTYQQSARSRKGSFYTRNVQPVYRRYPTFYNWVIQNNFYLKHLALRLRGLPG